MMLMGRGGPAGEGKQLKGSSQASRVHLLASTSEHLEGASSSSSHSSGSLAEANYVRHNRLPIGSTTSNSNHQNLGGPSLDSDGSIFTLSSNNNQQNFGWSRDVMRREPCESPPICAEPKQQVGAKGPELSAGRTSIGRSSQDQHRRLQYQVHQQLQRIYGNKLHAFEQRQQQQPKVQRQSKQSLSRRPQFRTINQEEVLAKGFNEEEPHEMTIKSQHFCLGQQSLQQASFQEQAYDLIEPASLHYSHHRHHHNHSDENNNHSEEEDFYDMNPLPPPSQQQQHHHRQHHPAHQRPPICPIPEESNDDDEELLIRDEPSPDIVTTTATKRSASIMDRKEHLESLHYATATAAALLNVTASAAAAFAATEKQTRGKPVVEQRPRAPLPIYSETYQDLANVRRLGAQSEPFRPVGSKSDRRLQLATYRPPIYATAAASDRADFNRPRRTPCRLSTPQVLAAPGGHAKPNRNQQQQQIYNLLASDTYQQCQPTKRQPQQHQQQQLQQNFCQPMPMRPPLPSHQARGPHLDFLRPQQQQQLVHQQQLQSYLMQQQQQQQQQPARPLVRAIPPALALPNGLPALAILHQGPKGPGLKVDLVGRFPLQQQQQQQQQQQRQVFAALNQKLVQQPQQAKAREAHHGAHLAYGVLARDRLYGAPGPRQFIPVQAVTSGASSDASGQSNLPLVLDRQLKPLTFVERICHIDLTLFWWSLLFVCLAFIATVITISRYVF